MSNTNRPTINALNLQEDLLLSILDDFNTDSDEGEAETDHQTKGAEPFTNKNMDGEPIEGSEVGLPELLPCPVELVPNQQNLGETKSSSCISSKEGVDIDLNEIKLGEEVIDLNCLEVGREVTLMLDVVTQKSFEDSNLVLNDVITNDDMALDSEKSTSDTDEENEKNLQKKRSRKRTVNKKNWKSEVRKRNRVSGKEYTDRKGKIHRAKNIQGECKGTCKFKCSAKIGNSERNQIHTKFWSLSDTGKNHFYGKFVERHNKERKRTDKESNRQFSYFYYLGSENEKIRVCKEFFFKTLDISQRTIYYFFQNVYSEETCTARSPLKGLQTKSHIEEEKKEEIREHIKSFPKIEAHYCRKDSQKEYLKGDLTLTAMYRLYVAKVENPLKESLYRHIFNTEFNLEFFKPKKDRCDTCEAFKANINQSEDEIKNHEKHIKEKESVKTIRDLDRNKVKMALNDAKTCVVAFDLENVLALPRAEVSNFFYKRKLNCYNLTAHIMYRGQTQQYCIVWHEAVSGRAGNHLASCVYKVLKSTIARYNDIEHFILWSDSCVPQNKNSIMTLSLQTFLKENSSVCEIIQRFSEPGHGCVQEVDSIHSKIEKWLKSVEVFSPLSLVRLLVKRSQQDTTQMHVIQMQQKDFYDFQSAAKFLNYSLIPYTKVKEIILKNNDLFTIKYRTSFTTEDLVECQINKSTPRKIKKNLVEPPSKKRKTQNESPSSNKTMIPAAKMLNIKPVIQEEKKKDIRSMMKFMPEEDKKFYAALFK